MNLIVIFWGGRIAKALIKALFQIKSIQQLKEKLHKFIMNHISRDRIPLCINPMSAAYKSFTRWVISMLLALVTHQPLVFRMGVC